ncbi:unnamed protein product [Rhizophagus irregularis]|uniref:Uncharacterized protein n=2 Tax=Rhizophagus irregularis TaxID=588596 RepID=A0A915ZHF3_9GLOM|nr:unnamed protein product [Rhizophagus irregularis]
MITINLELWQNPNFPPLEILESRTKTVLENFNRCRKLNIKLHIKNDKIEELYPLFNSLTERRAVESYRLSMYAEDVVIYMKLLSEENTSIGVVLETLSSLLDTAQERHEITKMLKEEYQEFFDKFNGEFSNIKVNLTSDNRQIATRNEAFSVSSVSSSYSFFDNLIKFVNYTIPILSVWISYRLIRPIIRENGLNLMIYLLYKGKEYVLPKYQDSQEKLQGEDRDLGNNNNNYIEGNGRNDESYPTKKSSSILNFILSPIKNLYNKWNDINRKENYQEVGRIKKDINFDVDCDTKERDSIEIDHHDSADVNKRDPTAELDLSTKTDVNELCPTAGFDSAKTTDLGNINPATNTVVGSDSIKSLKVGEISSASSDHRNMLINLCPSIDIIVAGFFSPKFRQVSVSDEQQQNYEKDDKILEIKEKLPVVIQNVGILDQFWFNQVTNIKSHIETLSSVDENEKIRFPKQIADPIKEEWNNQHKETKANHARMKDLVTRNSLLSIDVSILRKNSRKLILSNLKLSGTNIISLNLVRYIGDTHLRILPSRFCLFFRKDNKCWEFMLQSLSL